MFHLITSLASLSLRTLQFDDDFVELSWRCDWDAFLLAMVGKFFGGFTNVSRLATS